MLHRFICRTAAPPCFRAAILSQAKISFPRLRTTPSFTSPRFIFSSVSSSRSVPQPFAIDVSLLENVQTESEGEMEAVSASAVSEGLKKSNSEVIKTPPPPPPPSLSVKEKKELGSYAHSLGKKLKSQQVGKSGVTDTVVGALIETLEANELLKVFSLVLQEERQRSIGQSSVPNPVSELGIANAVQGNRFQFQRGKERPICSHCGRTNHTIDTCFEVHGFPPGYGKGRGRGRGFAPGQGRGQIHQTSASYDLDESVDANNSSPVSASLSVQQCQQLLSFLGSQLHHGSTATGVVIPPSTDTPSASSFSGNFSGTADWDG